MTDVRLPLVLEALGTVDAELARLHYALRDLAARPSADSPALPRARFALRRGFAAVRTIRGLLVDRGLESYEHRASSLRARGIVVLLQLTELRDRGVGDLVGVSFPSVEAFTAYVLSAIGRANAQWVGRADDAAALLRAERAFANVGRDPRVASVLQRGASCADPHLRLTCATLGAMLDAGIEAIPAPLSTREVADG